MPIRKTPLVNGQYYHIYNRGVARQPIFQGTRDYERFILSLSYYQYHMPPLRLAKLLSLPVAERGKVMTLLFSRPKIVDILSFACLPNHFHLLVKQRTAEGISTFMGKCTNSYAKYSNTRRKRVGPLYQGRFRIVRVETGEQLLHLSRYIHLNPLISHVIKNKELLTYPWSSFPEYVREKKDAIADTSLILKSFPSRKEYVRFVLDQVTLAKTLQKVRHLALEE